MKHFLWYMVTLYTIEYYTGHTIDQRGFALFFIVAVAYEALSWFFSNYLD